MAAVCACHSVQFHVVIMFTVKSFTVAEGEERLQKGREWKR